MDGTQRWLRGPLLDTVMAWSWVPFALVVLLVPLGAGQIVTLMSALLVVSFSHQTLTLPLVYGDHRVFGTHRRLFAVAPVVFVVVIAVTLGSGGLLIVAAVGALWNAEHTLMQRFGIVRIYGRQVGQDEGGVERPLLFVGFLVAIAAASASGAASHELRDLGLKGVNHSTVDLLEGAQPLASVLLVPLVGAVIVLAGMWWWQEFRSGRQRSRAKHQYLASTAVLFALAVVNPVAGLFGFVGSHAVEYYIIVDKTVRSRYGRSATPRPGVLSRALRGRRGMLMPIALYVVVMVAVAYVWKGRQPLVYSTIVLSIGATHFLLDSFIWKLRRPDTAESLEIHRAADPAPGSLAPAGR